MASKRPSAAIGHVVHRVGNVAKAADFYESLGLRSIMRATGMAILEMRGGTHLLLMKGKAARTKRRAGFDLMVEDVHAFRRSLARKKVPMSEIEGHKQSGHELFEVTAPDGHRVLVFSSHAGNRPV